MKRFERQSGVAIPPDYQAFLRGQNGGAPVNRNVQFGTKAYQDSVLRCFLGVGCHGAFDLRLTMEIYADRLPAHVLPIACDKFDNLFVISTKADQKIWFWDHERELTDNRLTAVADQLVDFLQLLTPDKLVTYRIATVTYQDGTSCRRVLPFNVKRKPSGRVVDIGKLKSGDIIDDFGVARTIASVVIGEESH